MFRVHYGELLGTTRFLLVKSFQLLDGSASTRYAQLQLRSLTKSSVQDVRAVRTSAESSPVLLFLLLIRSFQAPLIMGDILTEPSSRT